MRENSRKLGELLQGREDWQAGMQDDEGYWHFGVAGTAAWSSLPRWPGFLMFRADEDRSWVIPRTESVEEWLDEHEAEHTGLMLLQEEFRKALEGRESGASES